MKYAGALLAGLIVGGSLALTGLYYNPLTRAEAPLPGAEDWVLAYGSPLRDGLAFIHSGESRLPRQPLDSPVLWESTIDQTFLSLLLVNGADGEPVGIASRISFPSEDSELLARGVIVTDQWMITLPGEGSLFIHSESNLWPFLTETLLPVWYLGRPWDGPATYSPTAGPGPEGAARAYGATGRFAGLAGSAVERYRLVEFSERLGPEQFEAELFVNLAAVTLGPAATGIPAE